MQKVSSSSVLFKRLSSPLSATEPVSERNPEMPPASDLHEIACPRCGRPLSEDVIIRCAYCRARHHLACYGASKGCAQLECPGPDGRSGRQRRPSEQLIAEGVFRHDLHDHLATRRSPRESFYVSLVFAVLAAFMLAFAALL